MAAASGPGSGLEGGGGADGREAVAAALSGLGEAFVALGKAILAIDVKKATVPEGKKKKPAKDKVDKEKRKPTAYNLFVKEESGNLRKADILASQQEIMKNLGTKWRELSHHEKEQYKSRAAGTEIPATPGAGAGVSDDEDAGRKRARSDKKKADSSDEDSSDEKSKKKKKKKKKKEKERKKSSSGSSDSD